LAVGDLDDDGRLDVVINDLDGSPQPLRNELATAGNWLLVRLKGTGMNTGAVGAVVTARTSGSPVGFSSVWCRAAAAATSHRKTSGCTSGWAKPHKSTRWKCGGLTVPLRRCRTSRAIKS